MTSDDSALAVQSCRGQPAEALQPDRTDRPRVLLVDDEENILASLRRLLRREPYDLVIANSAREALEVLEQTPVQLVITDFRMPGMTGVELLQEVQRRWPHTIRIILSGYSEVRAIIAAINEGSLYKFITKPWNDEEIKLNIRRALEQYALEAENRDLAGEIAKQNAELLRLNELLQQHAADATTGQALAQQMMEAVGAGVMAVDETGLIVSANLLASSWLNQAHIELIGRTVDAALPKPLLAAFRENSPNQLEQCEGSCVHHGHHLQWRCGPINIEGSYRGSLITLWEEVR
jgi:response regulator RpfG family c-di-GMP phosphodiesterase